MAMIEALQMAREILVAVAHKPDGDDKVFLDLSRDPKPAKGGHVFTYGQVRSVVEKLYGVRVR